MWGHEYVITSLLEIAVSKNKTRRPPSAGGTLDRTSFAATRSVCLEGALARPRTILVSCSAEAWCPGNHEVVFLWEILREFGYPPTGPTTIYEDNFGCVTMSGNPVRRKYPRHIDLRRYFVRDLVAQDVSAKQR